MAGHEDMSVAPKPASPSSVDGAAVATQKSSMSTARPSGPGLASGPAGSTVARAVIADTGRSDALGRSLARVVSGRAASGALQREGEAEATTLAPEAPAAEIEQLVDSNDTLTGTRISITDELLALITGDADHSEPPLLKKHRADSPYTAVPGTAFGGVEPSATDVKQGAVGDC